MLTSLRIHNIALIEDLEVPFFAGMQVLSGETGAGKSIVVDAVNLVLGGRADRDLIRYGTDRAWVEACFDATPEVRALLRTNDLEAEGGEIVLGREISRSGRNLCRLNGVTVPLTLLRETAGLLMDVHGQHEHQFLLDEKYHLAYLDAAGDEAHQAQMARVADACAAFLENHRAYARLRRESEQKAYRMDTLTKSLAELEKAQLKPGEAQELTRERDQWRQGEKVAAALGEAHGALSSGEEEESALARVKRAMEAMRTLENAGPPYDSLSQRFASTYYELEEIAWEIAAKEDETAYDPERAEWVEERLDRIRRLERKYGAEVPEILRQQEEMRAELEKWTAMDDTLAEMGAEHKRLLYAYRAEARRLTESRQAIARDFEQRMMAQLAELGMEHTVFQVAFLPPPEGKPQMPQPTGDDRVAFLIAPNPGEPLKPLAKIASGGELSRVMLALKSLEADQGGVGSMVFDEIDTGISGRMAQVVAEKMARIARKRQVICVSHLPQIAAMADYAFLVEKRTEGERTLTSVRLMTEAEREAALARMLGGADGSGDSALSHARHMLAEAKTLKV